MSVHRKRERYRAPGWRHFPIETRMAPRRDGVRLHGDAISIGKHQSEASSVGRRLLPLPPPRDLVTTGTTTEDLLICCFFQKDKFGDCLFLEDTIVKVIGIYTVLFWTARIQKEIEEV